jgi:hypothetical protein
MSNTKRWSSISSFYSFTGDPVVGVAGCTIGVLRGQLEDVNGSVDRLSRFHFPAEQISLASNDIERVG